MIETYLNGSMSASLVETKFNTDGLAADQGHVPGWRQHHPHLLDGNLSPVERFHQRGDPHFHPTDKGKQKALKHTS